MHDVHVRGMVQLFQATCLACTCVPLLYIFRKRLIISELVGFWVFFWIFELTIQSGPFKKLWDILRGVRAKVFFHVTRRSLIDRFTRLWPNQHRTSPERWMRVVVEQLRRQNPMFRVKSPLLGLYYPATLIVNILVLGSVVRK